MAVLNITEHEDDRIEYVFWCPGCECGHRFMVGEDVEGPAWDFSGDRASPTFSPSLKVTLPKPEGEPDGVCHLFVRQGEIQYLSDSTHDLAGETVPMRDWKDLIDEWQDPRQEDRNNHA